MAFFDRQRKSTKIFFQKKLRNFETLKFCQDSDQDLESSEPDPRIRIRIKMKRIHNTVKNTKTPFFRGTLGGDGPFLPP